tara:strand:- start:125120 stop:126073 length:954 start_codon:yes stop_codon:yes gene_type:complete
MSVEKLLKDFEKKLSFGITTYSKNTIISYVDDVRLYLIKNGFEHLKIEELFTENRIINYFEMLLTSDVDKYKKSSAKRKLSSISKFIDFLVDKQLVPSNFINTLDKKILLGNKIETPKANFIDQKKLYNFTNNLLKELNSDNINYFLYRDIVLVLTLIFTGLRVSELINIKISNINSANNEILGITRKGWNKNKSTSIPIDTRYLQIPLMNLVKKTKQKNPNLIWLFINRKNEKLTRQNVYKIVKKLSNKYLGYSVNPHLFRHSFATSLISNGATTTEVQKMLDHKNVVSTEVYEHVNKIKKKYNLVKELYKKNGTN